MRYIGTLVGFSLFLLVTGCAHSHDERDPAFIRDLDEIDRLELELYPDTDQIDEQAKSDGRCSRCPAVD